VNANYTQSVMEVQLYLRQLHRYDPSLSFVTSDGI